MKCIFHQLILLAATNGQRTFQAASPTNHKYLDRGPNNTGALQLSPNLIRLNPVVVHPSYRRPRPNIGSLQTGCSSPNPSFRPARRASTTTPNQHSIPQPRASTSSSSLLSAAHAVPLEGRGLKQVFYLLCAPGASTLSWTTAPRQRDL